MDKITLISSDGVTFRENRLMFQDSMIYDIPSDIRTQPIPMDDINAPTLKKVIEWCDYHHNLNLDGMRFTEKREKVKERKKCEEKFLQVGGETLLNIIRAVDYLDIQSLIEASCRKAAEMIKNKSLHSASDLPAHLQAQVAQSLPPWAFKKAAEAGILHMTPEQQVHNKIWTSLFKKDDWFETALEVGANPVLIGKDLESNGNMFLVLSSMDWTGDLFHLLNERQCNITDFLQGHDLDETTYECTMKGSQIKLNIWESRCAEVSIVQNVEERLVRSEPDGKRWTAIMSLRSPSIHRLVNESKPNGRLEVVCRDCLNPYGGEPLEWTCVDSLDARVYKATIPFRRNPMVVTSTD
jgi:S-phase kinase-associated protein 1